VQFLCAITARTSASSDAGRPGAIKAESPRNHNPTFVVNRGLHEAANRPTERTPLPTLVNDAVRATRVGLIVAMRKRSAIGRTRTAKRRPSVIAESASHVLSANCAKRGSGAYLHEMPMESLAAGDKALSPCASFFTNLSRQMTFVGARRRASCEKAHDVRV
jgi:hypothetical protein